MQELNIGFIGGGTMADSIISGLYTNKKTRANVYVCDPDKDKVKQLVEYYDVIAMPSNEKLLSVSDVIILAIKPNVMQSVLNSISIDYRTTKPLFISIAAGIKTSQIAMWLDYEQAPVIRVMPNTPAKVGMSACGLYANKHTTNWHQNFANRITNSFGISEWVEEEALIDSVTAVSGCGPAYFLLLMQAMQEAAVNNGLSEQASRNLILQTAVGVSQLAKESKLDFKQLGEQVATPNGATEAGINSLKANCFSNIIEVAIHAARTRAEEMSTENNIK